MSEQGDEQAEQAAGKPEGNEGLANGRAWVREFPPEEAKPKGLGKGGSARGRTAYARELEGGGCLLVSEDGNHRVVPKFSPPEGEGWRALHDESQAKPEETAGNRWKSKQERKGKALAEESKRLAEAHAAWRRKQGW